VHGYHEGSLSDVPVDVRRVLVVVADPPVCPTRGCRQSFREHLPGGLERYQRPLGSPTGPCVAFVRTPGW
jgi:hypothetical protein